MGHQCGSRCSSRIPRNIPGIGPLSQPLVPVSTGLIICTVQQQLRKVLLNVTLKTSPGGGNDPEAYKGFIQRALEALHKTLNNQTNIGRINVPDERNPPVHGTKGDADHQGNGKQVEPIRSQVGNA